ncbi:MAG: hypothetical protein ACT4PN_11320 [Nitrospiraceae bacterium]
MSPEILLILAGMVCVAAMIGLFRWAGGRRLYALSVSGLLTVAADYLVEWLAQGRTITLLVILGVLVALMRRFEKTTTLALTVFLCVFVSSTVLRNGFESESNPASAVPHTDGVKSGLPPIVHLILDEHIGIEGIPDDTDYAKEVKRKIKQFYQRYGFELYGGAYSHYLDTLDSIPNLVNFSAESVNKVFIGGERPPYTLQQNRYFHLLNSLGYQIHVMHGDYIDFCSTPDARPNSCSKFGWFTLSHVAKLDIPLLTKMETVLAAFVASYTRYQAALDLYEQRVRPFLLSHDVAGPAIDRQSLWTNRDLHPFSVNAMAAMGTLSERMQQLTPGHMLFAHLMLPHYPYVYREDCSPRPIQESLDDMELVPLALRTPEDRRARYDQYLRQVECLYVRLDELFRTMQSSGVFSESIVMVHGDHGGRLGIRLPISKEQSQMTVVDYGDGLSALFAARIPGKPGGYDPSLHTINELFVQTLGSAVGKVPPLSAPQREPFVYLYDGHRKPLQLVEMPWRPKNLPDSPAAVP